MDISCYQVCNETYSAMQPERIYCKKGCDSQNNIQHCKSQTCNVLCIKQPASNENQIFNFLYRAPKDSGPCLQACIKGCNNKQRN